MARSAQSPQSQSPAPVEPAPVVALAAQADVRIDPSVRVFVDVANTRTMLPDGRIVAIRREQRADGSLGPFVAHLIRVQDGRETGNVPATLLDMEQVAIAYERKGMPLFRSAAEYDSAHPVA